MPGCTSGNISLATTSSITASETAAVEDTASSGVAVVLGTLGPGSQKAASFRRSLLFHKAGKAPHQTALVQQSVNVQTQNNQARRAF